MPLKKNVAICMSPPPPPLQNILSVQRITPEYVCSIFPKEIFIETKISLRMALVKYKKLNLSINALLCLIQYVIIRVIWTSIVI